MKKRISPKAIMKILLVCLAVVMLSGTAMGANAGWNKNGRTITYYVKSGSSLVKVTGIRKIGNFYYYFSSSGALQTGWQKFSKYYRYFQADGSLGKIGRMYTGFRKIGTRYYYFNKYGYMCLGLRKIGNYYYFFKKTGEPGVVGRAYRNAWANIKGDLYYFGANCRMVTSSWVKETYYVDESGKLLKNTITPDGYLVGANGRKVGTERISGWVEINGKYYTYSYKLKGIPKNTWIKYQGGTYFVDKTGARVSGLQRISGATYYFDPDTGDMYVGVLNVGSKSYYFDPANGKMLVNGSKNGFKTDSKGVIIKFPKKKILIDAGHGQGDPGAVSPIAQEYLKTREFAKLIYKKLSAVGNVEVTYLMNGSTQYDLYQRNSASLSGLSISGNGSNKAAVINRMRSTTNIPDLSAYDYVLEVHFNATGYDKKDYSGDGNCKGFMIYVNQYKPGSNWGVDRDMIAGMSGLGFRILNTNPYVSSGLFNARVCQEVGTNYSLIETAFIDDKDDMNFYEKNKDKMAQVVVNAIKKNILK